MNVEELVSQKKNDLVEAFRQVFIHAGERQRFLGGIEETLVQSGIIEDALRLGENIKTKYFSVYIDVFLPKYKDEFDKEMMEVDSDIDPSPLSGGGPIVSFAITPGLRVIESGRSARDEQSKGRILVRSQVECVVSYY